MQVEPTRRQRHEHKPEVRFLGAKSRTPDQSGASVFVVCGPPHSALVARARETARGEEAGAMAGVPATPAPPDPHEPIVEVRYHGTPIVLGALGVDGLCARLPFAGGALDPERFATCAYVAAGDPVPALTTLVIVREPILSDLERRALDRLPSESRLALAGERDAGATVPRLLDMRAKLILAGRLS